VIVGTRCIAALVAVATALAACGGGAQKPAGADAVGVAAQTPTAPYFKAPSPYLISLPASSEGPTTCTVYESDYTTQIVVDSPSVNVRAECELWAANQPGVAYLWGYEAAAATPDVLRLCTLTDPHHKMTATVIEDTGFVPLTPTQRANGGSACAAIRASGWTKAHRRAIARRRPQSL